MENLFFMNLQMGFTAILVILVVFFVRWGIRRAPKKYSYVLWAVVGMRLIFPFSVPSVFSLFNLNIFQKAGVGKNIVQPVIGEMAGWQAAGAAESGSKLSGAAGSFSIPHIQPQADVTFANKVLWAGAVLWLVGIFICLMYFLISWIRIKRRVRKAVCWKDNIWECEAVDSPFVMGVFRPKIYIPFHLEGMERKMLLLHETCHIRRRDYLVKLLAFALLAVYWYYPFVWAAYFAMMKDMEMSCDEWVLERLGADQKKEYSRLLLSFAEGEHEGAVSGILGFGENVTKNRIKNVLDFRHLGRWKTAALAVLCAAVVIFLVTNGVEKKKAPENTETEEAALVAQGEYAVLAETLYALKNPYVGDASADGMLFQAVCEAKHLTDSFWNSYSMSLETDEEPYSMQIEFSETPQDPASAEIHMADCGDLLLALIDNLSEVKFIYPTEIREKMAVETDAETGVEMEGTSLCIYWDLEAAKKNLRGNDVKKYGESQDSLEELLAILNDGRQREISAVRSEGIRGSMEAVPETAKDTYASYVLQASVSEDEEMFLPSLGLDREDKTFSFGYDILSSYLSCGTYEVEDDILTAVTNDGIYRYCFKVIDENTLEFMQEGSDEVRLINDEMGIAVKDGAIFKKGFDKRKVK